MPRHYLAITPVQMNAIIDVLHSRYKRALVGLEAPDEKTEVGRNILLWQVARDNLFSASIEYDSRR